MCVNLKDGHRQNQELQVARFDQGTRELISLTSDTNRRSKSAGGYFDTFYNIDSKLDLKLQFGTV